MKSELFRRIMLGGWVILVMSLWVTAAWAVPDISNVQATLRTDGSGMVDITYDLSGAATPATVRMVCSSNGGASWDICPRMDYLIGDLDEILSNGTGKQISWDSRTDIGQVNYNDFLVRLMVTDSGGSLGTSFAMIPLPAGPFVMGSRDDGDDGVWGSTGSDEAPRHVVTLEASAIGMFEFTNGQACDILDWAEGMGYLEDSVGGTYMGGTVYHNSDVVVKVDDIMCNVRYNFTTQQFYWEDRAGTGGTYSTEHHPLNMVTWYGAVLLCNWFSEREGLTPAYNTSSWELVDADSGLPGTQVTNGYRLPTEAEWERAAAWDGTKHWIYGITMDTLTTSTAAPNANVYAQTNVNPMGFSAVPYSSPVGWFDGNNISPNGSVQTNDRMSPVGARDMSGNVWEWCHDWFDPTYYQNGPVQNPRGPATGARRVFRDGCWALLPYYSRSAERTSNPPEAENNSLGFRVAKRLGQATDEDLSSPIVLNTVIPNDPPDKPECLGPSNGDIGIPIQPELNPSGYNDPDGDPQKAAQWQIRLATTPSDFSKFVLDTTTDTVNLTSYPSSLIRLDYHRNYVWRCRFMDDQDNWSPWSDEAAFTTEKSATSLYLWLPGDVTMDLMSIPGSTFSMGRLSGELDSNSNEDPRHTVNLPGTYWMGRFEVTKAQWESVMNTSPWTGQSEISTDPNSPAVYVSWNNAQSFITALNAHLESTGQSTHTLRLPSEAEWEYAARSGASTPARFPWGDDQTYGYVGFYGWYKANAYDAAEYYAHIVGHKLVTSWGLYDMHGNVYEWCQDYYHPSYTNAPTDGRAWEVPAGTERVARGGSWLSEGKNCRSAYRGRLAPTASNSSVGFRVVAGPPLPTLPDAAVKNWEMY